MGITDSGQTSQINGNADVALWYLMDICYEEHVWGGVIVCRCAIRLNGKAGRLQKRGLP